MTRTEVVGVDADLEDLTAAQVPAADGDVVLVVDDALDEVLERLLQHGQASAALPLASAASAGSSAFFSALASSAF